MSQTTNYDSILGHFLLEGTVKEVKPLGNGLINDTLKVNTVEDDKPDYVLQRINNSVFPDVGLLQHNIEVVTDHIREKLTERGEDDIDRKCLRFIKTKEGKTYFEDPEGKYWRVSVFIPRSKTFESVTPETSYACGKMFGDFENMLSDIKEPLGETIKDFHNMELRAQQLRDVVKEDPNGRVQEPDVQALLADIRRDVDEMCKAERLYREGKLPKRICHCDTKVNNMMYDENDKPLCVIDLDTVMPSFVFSDYGDFLRTAANFVAEDDPHFDQVGFNPEIFKSFTKGYLESARSFLTPIEIENLPYAVALFPFMQSVRFLWDYINGDKYWKVKYPTHNLVRAQNQMVLYKSVRHNDQMMADYIKSLLK